METNWNIESVVPTYEQALQIKNGLLHSSRGATLQVKIKRLSPINGNEKFCVKFRIDPSLKEVIEEVESKTSKKKR